MKKYWTVFQQSFQNEFVYRTNFILWRVRNVLRMLMTFFLWGSIFSQNQTAFGYTRSQIFSYVFLALVTSTFVISAPSNDNIGAEISNGDLSNFLVKPINYLKYWITRDWASKLLNMIFVVFEVTILWFMFHPQFYISPAVLHVLSGVFSLVIASLIYFSLGKIATMIAFWTPENTWGLMFIVLVFLEILSGMTFPLNVLPHWIYVTLQFTPFPYLVYFPISMLLGKLSFAETARVILQSLAWLSICGYFAIKIWRAGLKEYSAVGK